jgi:hypothetical protein
LDLNSNTYLLADANKAAVETLDNADAEAVYVNVPRWATLADGGRAIDEWAQDLTRPYSDVLARVGALRGMLRKWNDDCSGPQGSF